MQRKTFRVVLFLCVGLMAMSSIGCAVGVDRVKLLDPMKYSLVKKDAPITEAPIVQVEKKPVTIEFERVRDNRTDISCIGVKKNSYGIPMGRVELVQGVVLVDEFKKHLVDAFSMAGFEQVSSQNSSVVASGDSQEVVVAPKKVYIEAEIRTFWVEFMPGAFVVDALGNVIFEVRIFDSETRREILSEMFRGTGKVSSVIVTRAMFEESINIAYAQAMQQMYRYFAKPAEDTFVRKMQ